MISRVPISTFLYTLTCDRCGKVAERRGDSADGAADELIYDFGWVVDEDVGKVICDDCKRKLREEAERREQYEKLKAEFET